MIDIIIIIILITLNGYFSLAELALVSVKKDELTDGSLAENLNAKRTLMLIKNPEQFLSAVQVGTTLLGLIEGIFGGSVVAAGLESWFIQIHFSIGFAHILAYTLGIGAITYLTIVFGELVPKSIALKYPLKVSLSISHSLLIFSKIAYPFIWALTYTTHKILVLFEVKNGQKKAIGQLDIQKMLGTAFQQGLLEKQQLWMHENVIAYKNRTARSIMKPAKITLVVSEEWPLEQVKAFIFKHPYSYFPVTRSADNSILGILKVKQLLLSNVSDWHTTISPAHLIESKSSVRDVFASFKEMKSKFGVVEDNKRKFIGIIAMQDVMESVFGDIPEMEDYGKYFYQSAPKIWIAEDFIHLQRIRRLLSLDWIRSYESQYLSIGEMMDGEKSRVSADGSLVLHDVIFKKDNSKDGNTMITIQLP